MSNVAVILYPITKFIFWVFYEAREIRAHSCFVKFKHSCFRGLEDILSLCLWRNGQEWYPSLSVNNISQINGKQWHHTEWT